MSGNRTESLRPAQRDVYARLSQQLDAFVERERRASPAPQDLLEEVKLAQARLTLFGSAPCTVVMPE